MPVECLVGGKVENPSQTMGFPFCHRRRDDVCLRYVYHVRIGDSWS